MKVAAYCNLGDFTKYALSAFSFFTVCLPRVSRGSIHGIGFDHAYI
jgi:hypothetical protein